MTRLEGFESLERFATYLASIKRFDISALKFLIYLGITESNFPNGTIDLVSNSLTGIGFREAYQLENLDLSNTPALESIYFEEAPHLMSLNLSNNINLKQISIAYSTFVIKNLDLSNNINLEKVVLEGLLSFESLNLKNGNNLILDVELYSNSNLFCVQVDDAAWSTANWTHVDPQISFSEYCGY